VPPRKSTAVAVAEPAEQHPVITALDEKMPQIAQMLPAGLDADRFRRVAVQALVKNPELWECSPVSIVTAIVEAAQLGLEPTGLLGGAFLVPYNVNTGTRDNPRYEKRAQLIVGYRGLAELAWRSDQMRIEARVVHRGDEFSYQFGTDPFIRHVPQMVDPGDVTHVYAVASLRGGGRQFEVMTLEQVEAIRDRARRKNPVWDSDFEEMARKTAVRRLVKYLPLSPQVRDRLAAEDDISYDDAPVMRVAPPPRDRRAAIAARRQAALPGPAADRAGAAEAAEQPVAANTPQPSPSSQDTVLDVDDIPFDQGPASDGQAGDPWMRRLHAVGTERGLDHDALHAMAVRKHGVASLTDLSTVQRGQLMNEVEDIEPSPASDASPPSDPAAIEQAAEPGAPVAAEGEAVSPADPASQVEPDLASSEVPVNPGPSAPSAAAPSVGTPLSVAAFQVFAAAVLGIETTEEWELGELSQAELDVVINTMDIEDYDAYWRRLARPLRAVLMDRGQSPRQRLDRAIAHDAEERLKAVAAGTPA
jgi:recombination protein RecT